MNPTRRILSLVCFAGLSAAALAAWGPWTGAEGTEELPFLPSRLTTPDGRGVRHDAFPTNDQCLVCHVEIAGNWSSSMHAVAQEDPAYRALFRIANEDTGGGTDRFCTGCHSPPAVLSGHGSDAETLGAPASRGVSCVVCHSVVGPSQPGRSPANAAFVMDPAGPIRGPNGRPCRAVDGDKTPRKTVRSDYLASSEFCAGCHGAEHAKNGLVLEKTYDEWKGSVYAEKGIQCQDCHMQPAEIAIATARNLEKEPHPGTVAGQAREHVYSHEFLGGNTVISGLSGHGEHAAATEKLLKAAAAVTFVDLPARIDPDEPLTLRVKVTNALSGHNLPTSLVHLRQLWLDVRVRDAGGVEVYASGALDENGELDPEAVRYGGTFGDADGEPTLKPWLATRFLSHRTIPPRSHALETFEVPLSANIEGPVTVVATLRYRPFPPRFLKLVLGEEARDVPITDMAAVEQRVEVR